MVQLSELRKDRMFCKVCKRGLNREMRDDELVGYLHNYPADHEPDPVLETEIDYIEVCDFCNAEGPTWIYRVTDHVYKDEGVPDFHDMEAWLACDRCKSLVENQEWEELAEVSVPDWERELEGAVQDDRLREEVHRKAVKLITQLHASFRQRKHPVEPYKQG